MIGFGIPSPESYLIRERSSSPLQESMVDVSIPFRIKELRTRNLIHSPLLRLPYESLIRVLLFTMDVTQRTPTWTTILPTCHFLCQTILSTPELWRRIYCSPPKKMAKRFEMAAWSPTEIYAHFSTEDDEERIKAALDNVRDVCKLRCNRIHTLEFRGGIDVWPHFSWILDKPLPNLKHLSISAAQYLDFAIPLSTSIGERLETLCIDNVRVPIPAHSLYTLKNLHVGFSRNGSILPLTLRQLIPILDSSPRLEALSLRNIHPDVPYHDGGHSRPISTLPHLSSLRLTASSMEAASVLAQLSLPAITSFTLDSSDFEPSHLRRFFPDGILADRLFKDTPNFPYFTHSDGVKMGGFNLAHGWGEGWRELFLSMHQMVPLSVTKLEMIQDMFDESHWREFARLRPEVHSISSSYGAKNHRSKGLWCALLPDHHHPSATLFPKLESVVLKAEHLSIIPLSVLDCLRMRSKAGFKLKRLEVQDTGKIRHVGRQPEDFQSLADVFVYRETPIELLEQVDTWA